MKSADAFLRPFMRKGLLRRAVKLAIATAIAIPVLGLAAFFLLDRLYPFPAERIHDALATRSLMIRSADDTLIAWKVDENENWRLPVAFAGVSPLLVRATLAVEDKRFYRHAGVDPLAVLRAMAQNLASGRRVSGASTITMQTVRLLWQRPRRLSGKIAEAFRALQLERLMGKDEILELYFNLAPYGGNVVGAEAAARRYFNKSAASLTLAEAALLAGLPQSPSRYNPVRHPERARQRRWQVLDRMLDDNLVAFAEATRAGREELDLDMPAVRGGMDHFVEWVRGLRPEGAAEVRAAIRSDRQATVEDIVRLRFGDETGGDLSGPAVVVLSTADSSLLAYVGNSSDPRLPGGMVDAARQRRQPGSLLKPFIFAGLADRGALTPHSVVHDGPVAWPGYVPENMDRSWAGELRADESLRRSRNIPALLQLARLGQDNFAATLEALRLDPGVPGRQGLAMALGAREQTLVDMTNAYAALGRLGVWRPVRVLTDAPAGGEERRIWSEEAAWLTLSALSLPDGAREPSRAWKTGTSWNHRDAWAVVTAPDVTVGVWLGRRRGAGDVRGAVDALPLALEIADAMGDGKTTWPPPAGVEFVPLCAASGQPPGWRCPETVTGPVLKLRAGGATCRVHVRDGVRPHDVASAALPALVTELSITSPAPGTCYVVADGAPGSGNVIFSASSPASPARLYWFLDGTLIASTAPGETVAWKATAGRHALVVSDDSERTAKVVFSVIGDAERVPHPDGTTGGAGDKRRRKKI